MARIAVPALNQHVAHRVVASELEAVPIFGVTWWDPWGDASGIPHRYPRLVLSFSHMVELLPST